QYRHNLFDRKALAFHGKPPPGSGSSLPQNSLSDWSRIPNADHLIRSLNYGGAIAELTSST
ncbi:hypothetical protein, partial [Burkholderia gladioli]|uniref:hypothetical protein n=1 Tax=Burkholderia gladioli TaxID=28095 RepID=UPI001ABA4C8F